MRERERDVQYDKAVLALVGELELSNRKKARSRGVSFEKEKSVEAKWKVCIKWFKSSRRHGGGCPLCMGWYGHVLQN